jgi:hypothetical protein
MDVREGDLTMKIVLEVSEPVAKEIREQVSEAEGEVTYGLLIDNITYDAELQTPFMWNES